MFHCSDRQKNSTTGADAAGKYQLAGIHELYMRSKPSHHAVQQPVYRPRKALNIIRITPRSSAHYNAILYGKIVLGQYRNSIFSSIVDVFGHLLANFAYWTMHKRTRKALNIIRITPRSSAHYNAILYNKIVLAQYRTHGFLFLCASSAFLDTNRDFVHFCVLLCIVQ